MLIIWLSQGSFLSADLAIEHGNSIAAYERAFNTSDDQFLHTESLGSNDIRVSIVDPLDIDVLLPIPRDEMTTNGDAIGGLVSWPKKFITLDARVYLSKLKYKF